MINTVPYYEIWIDPNLSGSYTFYARALTLGDIANLLTGMNANNVGYQKIKVVQVMDIEAVMKFA